jgi:hypothetical protein
MQTGIAMRSRSAWGRMLTHPGRATEKQSRRTRGARTWPTTQRPAHIVKLGETSFMLESEQADSYVFRTADGAVRVRFKIDEAEEFARRLLQWTREAREWDS